MQITVKEAKQLIGRHKSLLSDLEQIEIKITSLVAEIRRAAIDVILRSSLRESIISDCNRPADSTRKNAQVERLVNSLYKYQRIQPVVESVKMLQDYIAEAKNNISLLNPGLAGISWFFGGKRVKENASQAYQILTHMLNETRVQSIPGFLSEITSVKYTATQRSWDTFVAEPDAFLETMENLHPEILHSNKQNLFQPYLLKLDTFKQTIAKSQAIIDEYKSKIKQAAEKLSAYNALQMLKSVPVEELNRKKAGFRVKTLRDAGFETIADIYSTSTYQLASLQGISENAAYSMKRIAQELLKEAQGAVKIKLSADSRNKYSTALISAIYIFRLKKPLREKQQSIYESRQTSIQNAKNVLTSVGDGLPWVFYTTEQREEVRSSVAELSKVIYGDFFQEINHLYSQLTTHDPTNIESAAWTDFKTHNVEYISILEDIVPGLLGNDDSLYGLPEDLAREIQEEAFFPDGLLCTLRRYQEWGVKYILHQKRVLLGDEMGLGKTVQAIATMVSLRNVGATHFMVICSASVITNWCREIVKHSKLRATKIHGTSRNQMLKSWIATGGVAVTTYETTAHIIKQSIEKIDLIVVDEAHYIKNPEAQRSMNVRNLCEKATRLLFMTGTALENRVDEMISLINVLQPQIASSVQNMTFISNAPQFRARVAPVYYRRKREDVLTELPELIEIKEWCTLNPTEKEIYERNVLARKYAASRRLSWDAEDIKQSCKAIRLLEIIEQAKQEERKVLVFSFFLDTLRVIGELLGTRCCGVINGAVPPPRRQELIDSFEKASNGSVLLAQIQSGGTGLNIQSASVVVICEPQFKPSIENQAISRAYRMGQTRNVIVFRLLCTNTIEERMTEVLEIKTEIFNAFADRSVAAEQNESSVREIDDKKFGQLIQEEIDRIKAEKKL